MVVTPLAAIVVRDGRRVVEVTGEDRRTFLDATLSQSLADLPPGRVRSALWLDVHGAPLAALDVVAPPADDILLVVAAADAAEAVLEVLANRTFLSQATFRGTDHDVVAVRGWTDPGDAALGVVRAEDDVLVLGRPDGVDLIGPATATRAWLERRGLTATHELAALHDHEVRTGQPRFGTEVVAPHLPEESGVLPTHVHLDKGCYPGQEAVARMWMLGRPRRRLVVLDLDAPAAPGDEVGEGRQRLVVTRATSAAPWAALAYAPADVEVGSQWVGGSWSGRVNRIVGLEGPQPGAKPGVLRRRDRRA